jgi:hypothetical protein
VTIEEDFDPAMIEVIDRFATLFLLSLITGKSFKP